MAARILAALPAILCISLSALLLPSCSAQPSGPTLGVDLPTYLGTADLLWQWSALDSGSGTPDPLAPLRWWQGAYLGNGLLGAMVTCTPAKGATPSLRIDIGRTDLWIRQQRQPIGYLTVTPQAAPLAAVSMRLVLLTATLHVNLTLANNDIVVFTLAVNAADPQGPTGVAWLFVSTLTGGADPLIVSWTPDTTGNYANTTVASGSAGGNPWGMDTQWWTQGGARDRSGDGGTYTTALTNFNLDCGQTIVLAVASDQRTADTGASLPAALAAVAAGVDASVEGLAQAHEGWWADFWATTSFFSFDAHARPLTTALEQFAHIAGYRYASSSRFTMSDLMGPWGPGGPGPHGATYCLGPWCQFVTDMNVQVCALLPTPSNRGVLLALPALSMFPSWLNNSWTAIYGSNTFGRDVNLLWWLANMYRYSIAHGDDAMAATSLLPGLRSVLIDSGLHNGTDNLLHVEGCVSPEYPMPRSTDCSYHLAIFRWAAGTAQALAEAFEPSDSALPVYRDILARLAPLPVDNVTGSYELAAGVPFSVPHRHYSHLLAIYDLNLTTPIDTMAASLCVFLFLRACVGKRGLVPSLTPSPQHFTLSLASDLWWNITCSGPQAHGPDFAGDGECRGFTQAAMAAMSNRLNRTEAALGNLTSYLTLVGLPNAMYGEEVYAGHPDEFSAVSESPYSAAASLYGMLLGSGGGSLPFISSGSPAAPLHLRLWPAAPWENATFFQLRGEGAVVVSAVRQQGATQWAAVEAEVGMGGEGAQRAVSFTLFCPDWVSVAALSVHVFGGSGGGGSATVVEPGMWLVQGLVRGGGVGLYPAGAPLPDFVVGAAQGRNETEFNYWGNRFVYKGELP